MSTQSALTIVGYAVGSYFGYPQAGAMIGAMVGGRIERWQTGGWGPYIDIADGFSAGQASHLARRLARWDTNPDQSRTAATGSSTFTTLFGIDDASALDVASLWAPRHRDEELRVPIGVTATGEPLIFDLKDESEGGMGPHGLMIGMTGSSSGRFRRSVLGRARRGGGR